MTNVSDLTEMLITDLAEDDVLYITDISGPNVPRKIQRQNLLKAAYGDIYVANKTGTQVLTGSGTFDIVTQFDTDGLSLNTTPDQANNKITIAQAGQFRAQFQVYASLTDTPCDLRFIVYWNGVATHIMGRADAAAAADDVVAIGAVGNFTTTLAAKDMDLRVEGSAASTLRIHDGALLVRRIGG